MATKDFITLLGPGGEMRNYFESALPGQAWVGGIYDELVAQLKENYTYFPLADEKEMGGWINWLEQHPRFAGMSQFKTPDGWQISVAVDTTENFLVVNRPVLIDAMYTAFNEFVKVTTPAPVAT